MKKAIIAIMLVLVLAVSCACSSEADGEAAKATCDIYITDEIYCEIVNLIHTNYQEYIGKIVKIEGVYGIYYDESTGNTYNYVFRSGPGCCDFDGAVCGFEFVYDSEMPEQGDWIEVLGVLDTHEEEYEGELLLYLNIRAESVLSFGKAQEGAVRVNHPQASQNEQ